MNKLIVYSLLALILTACARMGSPDGGWYDEQPPKILMTTPQDRSVDVAEQKITLLFDEYIVLDNASENVIISPPQLEQPEIKTKGKSIIVQLLDSLKESTTYTIDFSNAIKDNNEGNYMGNYTYSFSTGGEIDTLEVSGYVIDAETLEPLSSLAVGLYMVGDSVETDSTIINIFHTQPLLRVARTDSEGHFSVKGVKAGEYRVYALGDLDNNFYLTPNSGEQTAWHNQTVTPDVFDDIRQDTIWLDSLRIKSIQRVPFKHFTPDDIILRAFTETRTTRNLVKTDRSKEDRIQVVFSYGDSLMPEFRGLSHDLTDRLLIEANEKRDTITYWLKDTILVNTDTLEVELKYRKTYDVYEDEEGVIDSLTVSADSLEYKPKNGELVWQTDTIMLVPKLNYERRLKMQAEDYEEWEKAERKKKKRGQPYDSIKPPPSIDMQINFKGTLDPDQNIPIVFGVPLAEVDSSAIHLYVKVDTLWFQERFIFRDKPNTNMRTKEVLAEWKPGLEYSLEFDTLAFRDIYDKTSKPQKIGIKVKSLDEYGTLKVNMKGLNNQIVIAQLLDGSDNVVKECRTTDGVARFYYLAEKDYYLKVIIDENDNGIWDSGEFDKLKQPETIYYYPKEISCRAKWDIVEDWDPTAKKLNEQKPSKLRKSKGGSKGGSSKKVSKNAQRAEKLGIELPEELKIK